MISIWASLKILSSCKGLKERKLEKTGKIRKCCLQAFSTFSTMLSKGFLKMRNDKRFLKKTKKLCACIQKANAAQIIF